MSKCHQGYCLGVLVDCDISATVQVGMLLILYQQVRVDSTYSYTNSCNHI